MSKVTSLKYFAEKDTSLTIEFLNGKLTAIQLAIEKTKLIQEAIQMHKQEIIDAVDGFPLENRHLDGKDYYDKTFNQ